MSAIPFQSSSRLVPTLAIVLGLVCARGAMATDYGAAASGTWTNASTWTPSSAYPGSGDNAYIGSNHPAGAAATATVTLGGSQSVNNLYLGYGSATSSGTLNLAGNRLTVNSNLYFGQSGGTGTIVENGGSFSTPNLYLYSGDSLALGASDTVSSSVTLSSGSTLTLGASMTLSSDLDVEQGSTLNMAGYPLSAPAVALGYNDNQPVSVLNRGPISTANLYVYAPGQTFNLNPSDNVTTFILIGGTSTLNSPVSTLYDSNSAQATTTAAGNVSSSVFLSSSSTLTLGASMTLSSQIDVPQGCTLNMAGYTLSAPNVTIGSGSGPASVLNRGSITTANLSVYAPGQTFNLIPSDSVTNFNLYGGTCTLNSPVSTLSLSNSAQATTTLAGNVSSSVTLSSSSTLTLGASMTLNGQLDVEQGSTLNMAGYPLSAPAVALGYNDNQPVSVLNRGPISTANLYVYAPGQTFNLNPSDNVTTFILIGGTSTLNSPVSTLYDSNSAQATTTAAGNVSSSVFLSSSSTLTLGASMTLSSQIDVPQGCTLNMAGYTLSAPNVTIGSGSGPASVLNRGSITTANLSVYAPGQTFNLIPSDSVTNFNLYGGTCTLNSPVSTLNLSNSAQATTTLAGNVSSSVTLSSSSTLTLGASMTLNGQLDVEQGSTLNMAGYPLSAPAVALGYNDNQPISVRNPGPLNANYLYVGASSVSLSAPGSVVNSGIVLSGNSVLTLQQPIGQLTGLTFQGSTSAALSINGNLLQLSGGSNSGPSWIFRWQDPAGGSWVNTLTGSIAAGQIAVSSSSGYSVFDEEGYTYIAAPSTLVWNGSGGNTSWSNSANWGGTTPTAGQWLRFGALASGGHVANNNDLAANSLFYGIFFDSAAPSYNLQGNAIDLSGDVLNQSGSNQTISLNLQLVPGDGAFNTNTITFDSGATTITVSGSISGSGMALMKTGTGTLILSGTDTYDSGTYVTAGKVIVTSSAGLLDGSELIVGSKALSIFGGTVPAGAVTSNEAVASPCPVPEPGTLALVAAAVCGVVLVRRSLTPQRPASPQDPSRPL